MILLLRVLLFSALISITFLAFLPDYSALPPVVSFSDLLNHALAFCILYLLYRHAYTHSTKQIFSALFAYALFIEAVQAFLPTRYASIEDVLADTAGVVVGLILARMMKAPLRGEIG